MTALAVQIGNKTHTAGIMLPAGIEKTVHMSLLGRLGEWRENVPRAGMVMPGPGRQRDQFGDQCSQSISA